MCRVRPVETASHCAVGVRQHYNGAPAGFGCAVYTAEHIPAALWRKTLLFFPPICGVPCVSVVYRGGPYRGKNTAGANRTDGAEQQKLYLHGELVRPKLRRRERARRYGTSAVCGLRKCVYMRYGAYRIRINCAVHMRPVKCLHALRGRIACAEQAGCSIGHCTYMPCVPCVVRTAQEEHRYKNGVRGKWKAGTAQEEHRTPQKNNASAQGRCKIPDGGPHFSQPEITHGVYTAQNTRRPQGLPRIHRRHIFCVV